MTSSSSAATSARMPSSFAAEPSADSGAAGSAVNLRSPSAQCRCARPTRACRLLSRAWGDSKPAPGLPNRHSPVSHVVELVRSNDLVHLSWAEAMLTAAGIALRAGRRACQQHRGQHRRVSRDGCWSRRMTSSAARAGAWRRPPPPRSMTARDERRPHRGRAPRRSAAPAPAAPRLSGRDRPGPARGGGAGPTRGAGARRRCRQRRRGLVPRPARAPRCASSGWSATRSCWHSPGRTPPATLLERAWTIVAGDLAAPFRGERLRPCHDQSAVPSPRPASPRRRRPPRRQHT